MKNASTDKKNSVSPGCTVGSKLVFRVVRHLRPQLWTDYVQIFCDYAKEHYKDRVISENPEFERYHIKKNYFC